MYGCESWTIKKAERWRTEAFELWCWRRLLRVPWTARRSNQSILKEISAEYSLEGLMLKLKLQYFGHLMRRTDSFWKDPDAGKDWRQEKGTTEDEMVGWHHRLNGHEFEQAPGVGDGQGSLVCCSPWGHKESDTAERLNWTGSILCSEICAEEELVSVRLCGSRLSEGLCFDPMNFFSHETPVLLLFEPWGKDLGGNGISDHGLASPINSVLSAFQMPGTEEPHDACGPEESKGNLESPKQGSSKMKLKSRLSGKWTLPAWLGAYGLRSGKIKLLARSALFFFRCCYSVTKSCLTLGNRMDYSPPGSSVLHHLLEFAQIHVHWGSDAI